MQISQPLGFPWLNNTVKNHDNNNYYYRYLLPNKKLMNE